MKAMDPRWRKPILGALILLLLAAVWLALGSRQTGAAAPSPQPISAVPAPRRPTRDSPRAPVPIRLSSATIVPDKSSSGSFAGRVISLGTGEGIPNAELTLEFQGVASSVRTDASGAFNFVAHTPGTYRLAAVTADEFVPYAPEWGHSPITLAARAGHRIEGLTVYLQPAVLYAGVVVDPKGQPISGADVRVIDPGDAQMSLLPLTDRFVTDGSGEFSFRAANEAVLEARHRGFSPARARVNFAARSSRRLTLALGEGELPDSSGLTIEGRVLDPAGIPAEGARITAAIEDRGLHPSARATADGNGHFVLSGLDPGTYSLDAAQLGAVSAHQGGVSLGASGIELQLSAGGLLRGSVQDAATGQPVSAFTIAVSKKVGPLEEDPVLSQTFLTPGGAFEIHGVAPGDLAVTAAALGYGVSKSVSAKMGAAPNSEAEVSIVMRKGGRVTGVVREEGTGVPLVRARVSTENKVGSASSAIPALATAVTDAQGHFELDGLAEGLQSITAEADGHHGRILSGVHVEPDGSVGPVTMELTPTGPGEAPSFDLVGIGAALQIRDDVLVIVRVISGGGADLAQLVQGDEVLAVEGEPVAGLGFQGAIERIRGPEGSSVGLTVQKANGPVVQLSVTRSRVRG